MLLVGIWLCLATTAMASSEVNASGNLISDTCGITGCPADLSFPPCHNYTHQGEKGDVGERGEKGPQGDPGIQGVSGDKGEKGEAGIDGSLGETGDAGEIGEPGDAGEKGLTGEKGRAWTGEPGNPGERGAVGERGLQGPPGCSGEIGVQGTNGEKGEIGYMGLPGPRGQKGDEGVQGEQGVIGRPGARGPAGPNGEKGDEGELGNYGLKGFKGPRGSLGHRGPKGPRAVIVNDPHVMKGDKGEKGDTSFCNKLTNRTGEKGDKGELGAKGQEGDRGGPGRQGVPGVCRFSDVDPSDIIFPPEAYGDRGSEGQRGLGVRGEPGESGSCDNSECFCKKDCREETNVIMDECKNNYKCTNQPPSLLGEIGDRGVQGRQGVKGNQGEPGEGLRGLQGPRGAQGESGDSCDCCPECLKYSNTETYAVHSITPSSQPKCHGDDEELYRGYSLMHYASYSPSPTVSQDLGGLGSCVESEKYEFESVPFKSCSASEKNCRFAERRPVVLWLSNSTDSSPGMLNSAETAKHLSRCVACRSQGGVFFVNHTLSKEEPSCPGSNELWNMRYGGLARWQWKLRYTGLSWAMYQANDVQGGNMLQSPGSCYPGEFSTVLFYECQGPNRCYNKFGEFKNFWMMNAKEANVRFYSNSTGKPMGKYRREDVSPQQDPGILARCAVCELVPPKCTKCQMTAVSDTKLSASAITYVVHSQRAGGEDAVPKCSLEVDPNEESKPLWTGYSLLETDTNSKADLGRIGSCRTDFSDDASSLWLSGANLLGQENINFTDAAKTAVSRCAVCSSRYPVVVVHSAANSEDVDEVPSCPDSSHYALWQGYSLLSISKSGSGKQNTLSTSTGSCLKDIPSGACAVECSKENEVCKASVSRKCYWSLKPSHPMMGNILEDGKLPDNKADSLTFDWKPYFGRCVVCAVRPSFA